MKAGTRAMIKKIVAIAILLLSVFAIWLFRTYDRSEKMYSADRQYSYYFEKYNYNKVPFISWFYANDMGFGACTPCYYKRKLFVYDEKEQKVVLSKYIGDSYDIESHKIGFDEHDNSQFHIGMGEYFKLPRPVDEMVVRARRDSVRRASQELTQQKTIADFYSLPFISSEDVAILKPLLSKWLGYYEIDISQVRFVKENVGCFSCVPDTTDFYYREYTAEHDSPSRIEMDYSPSKQLYVDHGFRCKFIDGEYHEDVDAYDDCQEVYLVDRTQKYLNHIIWYGASASTQAAFWIDNNTFVIVSNEFDTLGKHVILLFDIANQLVRRYEVPMSDDAKNKKSYSRGVHLKEKGIIPL